MMRTWSGRWAAVLLAMAVLAILAVVAGCTAGPAAIGSPPGSSVAASQPPVATPSPPVTTATVTPAEPSASPEDSLEPPPAATLVASGSRHPGEPGSWVWARGSSDSPWLPAVALERATVPAGPVTVELAGGVDVDSWTARAAAATDTLGVELTPLGEGSGEPSFDTPEPGDWVVAVDVRFAGGLGSASYYWYVVVT